MSCSSCAALPWPQRASGSVQPARTLGFSQRVVWEEAEHSECRNAPQGFLRKQRLHSLWLRGSTKEEALCTGRNRQPVAAPLWPRGRQFGQSWLRASGGWSAVSSAPQRSSATVHKAALWCAEHHELMSPAWNVCVLGKNVSCSFCCCPLNAFALARDVQPLKRMAAQPLAPRGEVRLVQLRTYDGSLCAVNSFSRDSVVWKHVGTAPPYGSWLCD